MNYRRTLFGCAALAVAAASLIGCGSSDNGAAPSPTPPVPPAPGAPMAIDRTAPPAPPPGSVPARLELFASGFASPWGMAPLPNGEWLVAQKGGALLRVSADGATKTNVTGVPAVDAAGQGGLLDVALDPNFATNRRVYLAYSEPGAGGTTGTNGTAVARAAERERRCAD